MRHWFKKLFIVFFIFFSNFYHLKVFAVESMEDGARNKRLGLEEKDRDTWSVRTQKFITDVEVGDINEIKIFLKNNGDKVNFITTQGYTPLIKAIEHNNFEIINLFFKQTDVDVNYQDSLGNTAVMKAAEIGNIEIIEFLINKGADINHQNKQGITAAMKSVEKNHYFALKILLSNNVDLNQSDYTGRTIKDIARNSRDKRIIKLLN